MAYLSAVLVALIVAGTVGLVCLAIVVAIDDYMAGRSQPDSELDELLVEDDR